MAYLSKYGNIWGWLPSAQGRIFFVAPSSPYTVDGRSYDASDNNDGQSPERALATVARALALTTANVGDTVYLLEGTHTVTTTPRVQTAGISIVGQLGDRYGVSGWEVGPKRYRTILRSTGTSIPTLSIEANNVEVAFLTIRPTSGYSGIIFRAANPDSTHIHDCFFDLSTPAGALGTTGIDWGYRADTAAAGGASIAKAGGSVGQTGVGGQTWATGYVERCAFWGAAGQGRGVDIATAMVVVRDCWFHNDAGAWASPFVIATNARSCVVDSCTWTTTGTMGCCIEGSLADVADGVRIQFCTFPRAGLITSGLCIDNFDANEAGLVENYQASGTGGALVQLIT